jgi:cytochrome c biogenesis protein CcdA
MATQEAPTRQSVLEVLRELLHDVVRFARAEVTLLVAEGKEAARRALWAIAFIAGALVFAFLLLIFLLGAAAEAIGGLLNHPWLGWLILAAAFVLLAVILGLAGYRRLKSAINEGKKVGSIVKEDLEWVRQLPKRNTHGS